MYKSLNFSVFQAVPLLAAACVFAVKSLAYGEVLESSSTFATLAWFNLIFRTLIMVPRGVSHFVEARVSASRIESFLFTETSTILKPLKRNFTNNDDVALQRKKSDDNIVVEAQHCRWRWNKDDDTACLDDVTFTLKRRQVMCVVGEIGSGKTSLLCALQNDLDRDKSAGISADNQSLFFMTKNLRTLYIPQSPFVVSASLWENITFGLPYDNQKFQQVITACALDVDIVTFPDGINTQIGERGVTLSGGQNQRLALARACYASQDDDLILCDDVLSALDTTVAASIYRDVLSSETGLLKNTTRIIATHALWSTSAANVVLELSETGVGTGRVQMVGNIDSVDVTVDMLDSSITTAAAAAAAAAAKNLKELQAHNAVEVTAVAGEEEEKEEDKEKDEEPHQLIEEEESETGRVSSATWLRYIDAGVGRLSWSGLLLMFIITQVLRIATDWWIANWTQDRLFDDIQMTPMNTTAAATATTAAVTAAAAATNYEENLRYVLGYFAIVVVYSAIVFTRTLLFTFAMLRSSQELHNSMFRNVLHATMTWFWKTPTGRILNRFTRDVDCVDRLMIKSAQDWWNFMFIALGAVLTMISVVPQLLFVVVPLLLIFLMYTNFFVKTSRQLKRIAGTTRSPIYRRLEEYMRGINVVRSLQQENKLAVPFQHAIDLNVNSEFMFEISSRWLGVRLDSLSALNNGVLAAVAFFLAESLDAGLVGVALVQSLQLSGVLQYSIRQACEVESLMTSVERVSSYSKVPTEDVANKNDKNERKTNNVPPPGWPTEGNIRVENLCLRYRHNLPLALDNVNCTVSSGQVLGICGRTGSGKSSFMTSFFRLVEPEPCSCVEIDGINIFTLPLKQLRRSLTVITQMPVLLGGTIRSNIDPFCEHNDRAILECLLKCQLIRRLRSKDRTRTRKDLPHLGNGSKEVDVADSCSDHHDLGILAIEVHEGGTNFSAGERQLICVARALLARPKLLLLDEASSNIDPETDVILQATLRGPEFRHATKLVVAHRINTIIDADMILVLDQGKVVEFASPKKLLENPTSHFSKLVDATGEDSALELRQVAAGGT